VAAGEGGRHILAGRVNWFKNPFRRLFGIGTHTLERDETSDTSRETLVELTAGIKVNEDVLLVWPGHDHDIRFDTGIVNSLPQALPQFNQLPGMEGATIVRQKRTVRCDTRDQQLLSTRGTYVNLSIEFGQPLIVTLIYRRITGEPCDSYENMPCLLSTCREKKDLYLRESASRQF
jgi:hypothetical protein